MIIPLNDLPEPDGIYPVGTRMFYWTDSSRAEPFTEDPQDFRQQAVQVWYPAESHDSISRTPYIDYPDLRIKAIGKQLTIPAPFISHFDEVHANSYQNAPILVSDSLLPMILFSHGLGGMRYQNTAIMESLASHGYVVFALDHSYDANLAVFPDGHIAKYKAGKRKVIKGDHLENIQRNQLQVRTDDMLFLVEKIAESDNEWPGFQRLDHNRVGLIGHSLGGATIINSAFQSDAFRACLALDAWYIPIPDIVIKTGLKIPFLHIGQPSWKDEFNYIRMDTLLEHSHGPRYKVSISRTKHTDYTDMPLFTPVSSYLGYTGRQDPGKIHQILTSYTLAFFNEYLVENTGSDFTKIHKNQPGITLHIY